MGRKILGVALCVLAVFMGLGFARVGVFSVASIVALMVGAGLPAAVGVTLLRGSSRQGRLGPAQRELRRQTIEAEILRLAARRDGKLTLVEVVSDLAIADAEASEILDALHARGHAEIQITESGALVYDFRDVRLLGEKDSAKDVLDG